VARVSQDEEAVGRRPASRISGGRLPRRRRDALLPRVESGSAPTGAGGCRARWRTRPRTGTAGPARRTAQAQAGAPQRWPGPPAPPRGALDARPRVRSSGDHWASAGGGRPGTEQAAHAALGGDLSRRHAWHARRAWRSGARRPPPPRRAPQAHQAAAARGRGDDPPPHQRWARGAPGTGSGA